MSETLLATDHETTEEGIEIGTLEKPASRPSDVPEKFWDESRGTLRTEALLKSYSELERRFSSPTEPDVPALPDDYKIEIKNELLTVDPAVNQKLHSAGFTTQQAQLVYDLAAERLLPLVNEIASMFEAEAQIDRLKHHFGGEDRWRETSRQIATWGKANLPESIYRAMAMTYDGVVALHRMMAGEEPELLQGRTGANHVLNEQDLRDLMGDPRYWRDQDPKVVQAVRNGFKNLYGG